eukprot:TRINITY_DN3901_c0_g1_i1.p1 TRINITY_DN3901_c0_g1~~TRINITY_DN3901_c0_g1_i1.p1  ORF type:complete len:399 (+),score=53.49 TRINITY_DN3901_c0_g1_i1:27-1199(+)
MENGKNDWLKLRSPAAIASHLCDHPNDANKQDERGNTVLHYAMEWSEPAHVEELLRRGCDPRVRNAKNETPIAWACYLRRRDVVGRLMFENMQLEWRDWQSRFPAFCALLRDVPDCELSLHWAGTSSYIPGIGALLPSDDLHIIKRGSCIRLNFTFKGYKGMRLKRGNCSALFWGDSGPKMGEVWFLDHESRTYEDAIQDMKSEPDQEELDELAETMIEASKDKMKIDFYSKDMVFAPRTRWRSSAQVTEKVGPWQCSVFEMQNLRMGVSRAAAPEVAPGEAAQEAQEINTTTQTFSASIWMTDQFPLSVPQILAILDVLAPVNKRIQKLKQVLEARLPPGFPVKVNIPIKFGIQATANFTRAEVCSPSEDLFHIPAGYTLKDRKTKARK